MDNAGCLIHMYVFNTPIAQSNDALQCGRWIFLINVFVTSVSKLCHKLWLIRAEQSKIHTRKYKAHQKHTSKYKSST